MLGVGWGVPNPSRPTHDRPRQTREDALVFLQLNTYLMMLEYSYSYETYRVCLQQYLDSLGVGCVVPTPSRPTHDWPRLTRADAHFWQWSTYLMMLEYSDSYETYRICLQQYLDSIWIVYGCSGCWGMGWGCQSSHDGPTTDPTGICFKSTNMVIEVIT